MFQPLSVEIHIFLILCYLTEQTSIHSDINECTKNNGGCAQNCHNNKGSYYCSCKAGFSLDPNKHSCTSKISKLFIYFCIVIHKFNQLHSYTYISTYNQSIFFKSFFKECSCTNIYLTFNSQGKKCSAPPDVDGMMIRASSNWEFESYAEYSCVRLNHVILGDPRRQCVVSGSSIVWAGKVPTCACRYPVKTVKTS